MTKFKSYAYGPKTFRAYFKPVGHGFEIGLRWKDETLFVSNFVHRAEAMKWWKRFNNEVATFCRRYEYNPGKSFSWHCDFCGNYLSSCYYNWLEGVFKHHTRSFDKAVVRDLRMYKRVKRETSHTTMRRAA